jgi:diguanylate cyclase (GGDEF)-like protein
MKVAVERRRQAESGLAKKLAWPLSLGRFDAWRACLLGICVTGLIDLATGTEVWLGPIYLVFIGFAAWSLGWLQAIGVGFGSLAVTMTVNGSQMYPYSGLPGAWNIGVRIFAVIVLIMLFHTVRQMYGREWRYSRTDLLTGALNRKAFFELTSPRKMVRGWSMLIYLDLDGFKTLNDTAGHAAGDACLASFAQGIARAIRSDDVFARMGGDEFAIYLDVKDQAAGSAVASRLHARMNELLAGFEPVRCSVGALLLAPGQRAVDAEIRAADMLMYEAKGIGASLVAGTATQEGEQLTIHRHRELTPNLPQYGRQSADGPSGAYSPTTRKSTREPEPAQAA